LSNPLSCLASPATPAHDLKIFVRVGSWPETLSEFWLQALSSSVENYNEKKTKPLEAFLFSAFRKRQCFSSSKTTPFFFPWDGQPVHVSRPGNRRDTKSLSDRSAHDQFRFHHPIHPRTTIHADPQLAAPAGFNKKIKF